MKRFFLCPAVLSLVLFLVLPAASYELSADMTTKDGEQKQSGKLYVKGSKYRIDTKDGSEYAIIRHDQNKSWIVIPEQKAYIEMPFIPKNRPAIEGKQASEGSRRFLGSEVVNGFATRKYEVTTNEGGTDGSFYQWIAPDTDFPVKTSAVNGAWSIEYYNIKTSVPDTVFEIPESYEKITMPSAMK